MCHNKSSDVTTEENGAGYPISPLVVIGRCAPTCAVADAFVLDDVFVLEGFEDLDFPLKVPDVLGRAVLQLLHSHHLPRAVLQGVVPAHLHTAEVPLQRGVKGGEHT